MRKLVVAGTVSFVTGLIGHLIFYPIIEAWNNDRIRKLARPGIGVLINIPPFIVWLIVLEDGSEKHENEKAIIRAVTAYHLSFLWNGAGVAS